MNGRATMPKRLMGAWTVDARKTIAILLMLLAAGAVPRSAVRFHPRTDSPLKKVIRTLKKRGLNREATAKETVGYYEGLLDQAALVTQVGGRGWLDWRFWLQDRARRIELAPQLRRSRADFLRFDLPPNANVAETDERRRLITSSLGLADREYSQTPAPDTWRIALIGDSVARGVGAEFGTNFEARLEQKLNDQFAGRPFQHSEIINFSVQGYHLTQLVDVALNRVPPFAPNVYLVALTDRSVFTVWADHIASLVHADSDLKYDYLKQIVRDAGVTRDQSSAVINARLAPFRMGVIRWALDEMKAHAARAGAYLVVLLVPTPNDPEMEIGMFGSVKPILEERGIPTIDLLETYVDVEDMAPIRVSSVNRHPNEAGHKMLFDAIWKRLEADPKLESVFTGAVARPAGERQASAAR
jgi:hypothetical protein